MQRRTYMELPFIPRMVRSPFDRVSFLSRVCPHSTIFPSSSPPPSAPRWRGWAVSAREMCMWADPCEPECCTSWAKKKVCVLGAAAQCRRQRHPRMAPGRLLDCCVCFIPVVGCLLLRGNGAAGLPSSPNWAWCCSVRNSSRVDSVGRMTARATVLVPNEDASGRCTLV